MRIALVTDLSGQRSWHHWLAADLSRLGHTLQILRPDAAQMTSIPAGLRLAFFLDPILYRLQGDHAFDAASQTALAEFPTAEAQGGTAFDLLIDLSTSARPHISAARIMRIQFNGLSGELAAVSAVLDAGPIVVTLEDGRGAVQEVARPAIEQRTRLTPALDNIFTALVELLTARCNAGDRESNELISSRTNATHKAEARATGSLAGVGYLSNVVTRKIARYLDRASRTKNSWAIGTRLLSGSGLATCPWPCDATYAIIPDDGRRYYSDPLLFAEGGRMHLFAEEYPMATGKGIISVADVDERGNAGPFRPIIEREFHLSYPFVFEYGGTIWMLPEASASGSVELYRAIDYPGKWVVDRTLLDGVPGCDATILHEGGRYFMVLTASRRRGSTWDKQYIYVASTPLGPWTELPPGLQRIDCRRARPAGAAFMRGGKLLRPAQDCSSFYGGSMTLLEVHSTSRGLLHETPVATIKAASPSGITGTHTYSVCRNVEAIDVWGDVSHAKRVTLACAAIESPVEDHSGLPDR